MGSGSTSVFEPPCSSSDELASGSSFEPDFELLLVTSLLVTMYQLLVMGLGLPDGSSDGFESSF